MKFGPFKRFDHDHFFASSHGLTIMRDKFDYDSPFGLFGNLVDIVWLESYLTKLLAGRTLKAIAETKPDMFMPKSE